MSGQQDSNLRSPALKAGALPTGPRPDRARRYVTQRPVLLGQIDKVDGFDPIKDPKNCPNGRFSFALQLWPEAPGSG